ncbi:hypothetical protein [Anaplasma marginale]|uniref:hypothetical protein n=1 Tax=Anaplasma marginale TaxID=770 RepID=UPI0011EE49B5|nr:hypothetical protein [Anaplasma marginale]TZF79306.1 hypothetical protein FY180_00810 [Anaplasma marginale]
MGPKLLKAPSDLGKSLMTDPGCLYRGESENRKFEPALALLQYMYELAQRLNSKQVLTSIDFDGPEAASDDLLADKFVEVANVIGSPYSSIPKEAWRAVIKLVEATPDARTHLPKFLAECFDPDCIKFAKFEVCPYSHFTISAIPKYSGVRGQLEKRKGKITPAYLVEERVQFNVVNTKGESLGTFTMHTSCTLSRDKQLSSDKSVVMDAVNTNIQITNDLCRNLRQEGYKCTHRPAAKKYKIYLPPAAADGTPGVRRDITETPTRLLSSDDYLGRLFDGAAGVEYTPRIFRGLLGPALQVNPTDIDVVKHATFLKQSKIAHERSFPTSRNREQHSSVEKRAVIGSESGKFMHAVLRYDVVHKYEIPDSCESATRIEDLKLHVKIVDNGRGNLLFLTKDEVDTASFERINIKRRAELSTNAAWDDAATAQRCGYTNLAAKQTPAAQYSASSQDQWCFVSEDLLEDSYERYGVAHPDRPIITSEGVQRDTLNFLVSQAVYNEASQNVDPISMEIEKHCVSHRGLVSGSSINTEHQESGSQHRVEEHFILYPKGSRPNNTSLKVHAFVSYIVHGYDWVTKKGEKVALLGTKAQLGMRFVNPQFNLDECLQVGNSSIDSGSFQVFDIALKGDTRIRCDKFRDAIGKIDVAKDGALFSPSQSRDGVGGKRKEAVEVVDQGKVVFEQMAKYYGAAAFNDSEEESVHVAHDITGPIIPKTRTLASGAVGKLLRLYDMDAIHVVGRSRRGRAAQGASSVSSVRFAPCHSDNLSELAQKRLELLELLETWIKEIGHQTHTSLFEATINLCGNFSHEGFTQFLLSQFQDYTRFPSKAAIVDKKLFLQFDQSTSEDGKPQDKIRVVQHALVAPMAWWQTENLHLVVCYDVCVAQMDNGLKQLRITHPVAAVKSCSNTNLKAAKPYTSLQLERDNEFRIVRIPSNRMPEPVKALAVMQSAQDNFAGYKYLIQGSSESRGPGQSVSEKMQTCIMEFVGLHGIDKLLGSEYISAPDRTYDVLSEDCELGGQGFTQPKGSIAACYDEVANTLSRANYDKFVKFFCTALGITRIDDRESEWEDIGTSVFKDRLPPRLGGGIGMTHELAFSAKSVVTDAPLNIKVAMSYTLLYRGTKDGKNFFAMGDPSVTVSMSTKDGRKLGEASLRSDALALPLQAIIAVTSMKERHVQKPHDKEEQFVRKLQATAPQQKDEDEEAHVVSPELAAVMLSGTRDGGSSESEDQTVDDEEDQDEVLASKGGDAEPEEMELGSHTITKHSAASKAEAARGAVGPVNDLSQDIAACLSAADTECSLSDQEVASRPSRPSRAQESETAPLRKPTRTKRRERSTAQESLYGAITAAHGGYDSSYDSRDDDLQTPSYRSRRMDDSFASTVFEPASRVAWYTRILNAVVRVLLLAWTCIKTMFSWTFRCFSTRNSATDVLYVYDELRAHGSDSRAKSHPKAQTARPQVDLSSVNSVDDGYYQSEGRTPDATPVSYSSSSRTAPVSSVSTSRTASTRPGRHRGGNPTTVVDSAAADQLHARSGGVSRRARM